MCGVNCRKCRSLEPSTVLLKRTTPNPGHPCYSESEVRVAWLGYMSRLCGVGPGCCSQTPDWPPCRKEFCFHCPSGCPGCRGHRSTCPGHVLTQRPRHIFDLLFGLQLAIWLDTQAPLQLGILPLHLCVNTYAGLCMYMCIGDAHMYVHTHVHRRLCSHSPPSNSPPRCGIVMAYVVMALYSYGLCSHGPI